MSDIFNEVDEDVRRDKAAEFWQRYQTPIFVIAFLIVAATGAWSYYQDKRLKAAESANSQFMAAVALAEEGKNAEAAAAFDAIAKDAPKGYAGLARIRAAEARPDKKQALAELNAIGEDASVDKLTQQVAMLRAALLVLESGDREKFERALGPMMTSDGSFRFSAQEWNGLDALFNDDFDEAERVFEQVLNNGDAPQSMRQRASAYKGLLHARRGPKPAPGAAAAGGAGKAGGKIEVVPVIEPESGGEMPAGSAPFDAAPAK
ncbi:MAG: hypothetical protein CTY15_09330 [Methylocystis sp.]|nr:MAG: hypothetical protein CTY15_09330 [Methylocystis sp.]